MNLNLSGYTGTYLEANGSLVINLTGSNTFNASGEDAIYVYGVVTINNTDLNIDTEYNSGIWSFEKVTITNSNAELAALYEGIYAGNVTIKNLDVKAIATDEM